MVIGSEMCPARVDRQGKREIVLCEYSAGIWSLQNKLTVSFFLEKGQEKKILTQCSQIFLNLCGLCVGEGLPSGNCTPSL